MFPFIVFLAIIIYTDTNIQTMKYCLRLFTAWNSTGKTNSCNQDLNRLQRLQAWISAYVATQCSSLGRTGIDYTMECSDWESHSRQRTKVPAQLEKAPQQGVGPASGSIPWGHARHYSPIKALAAVFADVLVPLPRHLLSTQLLPSGAAGHMFMSTVVTGNTLLVLEAKCCWETEV